MRTILARMRIKYFFVREAYYKIKRIFCGPFYALENKVFFNYQDTYYKIKRSFHHGPS